MMGWDLKRSKKELILNRMSILKILTHKNLKINMIVKMKIEYKTMKQKCHLILISTIDTLILRLMR